MSCLDSSADVFSLSWRIWSNPERSLSTMCMRRSRRLERQRKKGRPMIQPPSQLSLPAWNEIGMGLANHLWQSTVFMIAVGALTLLFRKNSAFIRYRLWLIASVKFLIPLSLLIGVGTLIGERVEWPAPAQIEQAQISFVFHQIGQPFVAAPAMPPTFRAGPPLTAGASPLAVILTTLWLIGAAAVLVTWCVK